MQRSCGGGAFNPSPPMLLSHSEASPPTQLLLAAQEGRERGACLTSASLCPSVAPSAPSLLMCADHFAWNCARSHPTNTKALRTVAVSMYGGTLSGMGSNIGLWTVSWVAASCFQAAEEDSLDVAGDSR